MGILIEIFFFFAVIGSVVWGAIKHTTKTVSTGVKEKMKERDEKLRNSKMNVSEKLELSANEKEAIIGSLYYISISDELFNPDKITCITHLANDIGYKFNFANLLNTDNLTKYLKTLSALSEKEKDYYIMRVYTLQCTFGGRSIEALRRSDYIFKAIGISAERVSYTFATMESMMQSMNRK